MIKRLISRSAKIEKEIMFVFARLASAACSVPEVRGLTPYFDSGLRIIP